MRIWLVPFCELDNKRLVAQHHEWHVIEGKIREKGHRWKGWESPAHIVEFVQLHDQIVDEMRIREMFGHQTPVRFPLISPEWDYEREDYPRPREAIQEERFELLTRWKDGQFHGRQVRYAPDWEEVFARFKYHGGCPHERGWILQADGRVLCPVCKEVV